MMIQVKTPASAKKVCWDIGWIELPSGCVGYTTYCHHSFLGWGWWTETDHNVSCN